MPQSLKNAKWKSHHCRLCHKVQLGLPLNFLHQLEGNLCSWSVNLNLSLGTDFLVSHCMVKILHFQQYVLQDLLVLVVLLSHRLVILVALDIIFSRIPVNNFVIELHVERKIILFF